MYETGLIPLRDPIGRIVEKSRIQGGMLDSNLPALATFLKDSGAFTKLEVPFHLNLNLPPLRDPRPP